MRDRNDNYVEFSRYTSVYLSDIGWGRCESETSTSSRRRCQHGCPVESVGEERIPLGRSDYGNSKQTKQYKQYHESQHALGLVSGKVGVGELSRRVMVDCNCMDIYWQNNRFSPLVCAARRTSVCWCKWKLHWEMKKTEARKWNSSSRSV